MTTLILQLWHMGAWHDAADLTIEDERRGVTGPLSLTYHTPYLIENYGHKGHLAISSRYPVESAVSVHEKRWPAFLDDIMPSGHARKKLVERFGLSRLSEREQDFALLKNHTVAPIGNIRIKESVPEHNEDQDKRVFSIQEVVDRDYGFVDYAYLKGAASGGASGAGGEAPKFLVRETDAGQIWIDTYQDDPNCMDRGFLVKFPRNNARERDRQILKAEWAYYKVASDLGFETMDVERMRYYKGDEFGRQDPKPSLWLPRFDMGYAGKHLERYGMESVYSLLNAAPGTDQRHLDALTAIDEYLNQFDEYNPQALVEEYVKRDLLNVALGNSDNHCRNIAVIKRPGGVGLSPIYDLAPMKVDDEMIVRTTRWGEMERGGEFDWPNICKLVGENIKGVDHERCFNELRNLAQELITLEVRLRDYGVDETFLKLPALGFQYLPDKLNRWGLL